MKRYFDGCRNFDHCVCEMYQFLLTTGNAVEEYVFIRVLKSMSKRWFTAMLNAVKT